MKIRKTFVGNLPDNKIVNSNSTSETDTYSCKYLNERNVIVSSEEPTTGEEVWFQTSRNLFDRSNIIQNTSVDNNTGGVYEDTNSFTTNYIPVSPGKTYKFNGLSNSIGFFWGALYDSSKNYIGKIDFKNSPKTIFISDTNASYMRLGILNIYMANFIIREATDKIHTKTDNGYEEFYNEENKKVYSTEEQRIGTWIDGTPLYRTTVFREIAIQKDVTLMIDSGIKNINKIVNVGGIVSSSNKQACFAINTYNLENNVVSVSVKFEQDGRILIRSTDNWSSPDIIIHLEYTKTTDF